MPRADHDLSVSVIIPSYNGAAFLTAALDSALEQDHTPAEVILVDDGSTDSTPDIAARYGSRVHYHWQPRQGAGSARNTGLRLAGGNCIAFLDADDLWPAKSLSLRAAALREDPALACAAGLIEHFATDQQGNPRTDCRLPGIQPMRHLATMLVRRPVFDRIGVLDESGRLGEAFDWIARFSDSGLAIATIDRVVLRRRVHGNNTGILKRAQRSDYLHVLKGVIDRRRAAARTGADQAS